MLREFNLRCRPPWRAFLREQRSSSTLSGLSLRRMRCSPFRTTTAVTFSSAGAGKCASGEAKRLSITKTARSSVGSSIGSRGRLAPHRPGTEELPPEQIRKLTKKPAKRRVLRPCRPRRAPCRSRRSQTARKDVLCFNKSASRFRYSIPFAQCLTLPRPRQIPTSSM
jgi:hypothetical protein